MKRFSFPARISFIAAIVSIVTMLVISGLPVTAADWPDLEKIEGNIPGYVLPLTDGPNTNGGGSRTYLHWNYAYNSVDAVSSTE